jgi:hypothetical protein
MSERQKRSWNDITNAAGLPEEGATGSETVRIPHDNPETTRTILSVAQNPLVKTGVVFSGVALLLAGIGTFVYLSQPSSPEVASKPTPTASLPNTQIADLEAENSKLKADKAFGLTPTGTSSPNPSGSPSATASSPPPTNGIQSGVTIVPKNPAPVVPPSRSATPTLTPVQSGAIAPIVTPSRAATPTLTPVRSVAAAPITTPSRIAAPVTIPSRSANPIASGKPQAVKLPVTTVTQQDRNIAAAITGNSGKRQPDLQLASAPVQSRIVPSNTSSPPIRITPIAKAPIVSQRDRDIAAAITGQQRQTIPTASVPTVPSVAPKIVTPATLPIPTAPIASASAPTVTASTPIASAPTPVDWQAVSTSGTFGGRYDRNPSTGSNLASSPLPRAVEPEKPAIGDLAEVPVIPAVLPPPVAPQLVSNVPAAPVAQQLESSAPAVPPTSVTQQGSSNNPTVPALAIRQVASTIPTELPAPAADPLDRRSDNRLTTGAGLVSNDKAIGGKGKIEPTVVYSSDEMAVINARAAADPQTTEQSIQPGQVLKASLATPLQLLSEDNAGKPILLNINSPIVDLNGHIAIPSGAQIAGTFLTSNNGFVQLKTEKLVYQGKEITLPDNLFAIQSESGEPLLARSIQPGIGEASALARETGMYGAAQRVGQVLTAPDTNSTFSSNAGGVFSSNSSQNNRNVLGAVVEGFANPIVQQQQQRSTAEIARISGQQRIVYLPIGYKFNLVIARTFKTR